MAQEQKPKRRTYVRPPRDDRIEPAAPALIPLPDAKAERQREAAIKDRLSAIKRRCLNIANVVDTAITLIERGITLPDIAEAIGLPPTIERASKPLRPWRIRSNSNMAVIADMLEEAGRDGVSEAEMMHRLRDLGRLTDADKPLRAVHWTVTELQRRTRFVERRSRSDGARWYAYGPFSVWRDPARKNETA
jgi:hypothetical protein